MTQNDSQPEIGYFSETASTFGDRLAAARRAAKLTQETLSRKMGIKLRTLCAWEDDVSEPRANKLQMVAGVLNISIIWLLTGEGDGVVDPWEGDADADANPRVLDEVIAEIRAIRAQHRELGERLIKLEKSLAASRSR